MQYVYYIIIIYNYHKMVYYNSGFKHWTSFLNHSCSANCIIKTYIDNNNNINLGLFNIYNLKKGDELTINYKLYNYNLLICKDSVCLCCKSNCK